MLPLAFAKVSCASTTLLPLTQPSNQESQQRQSNKGPNNRETCDDAATKGPAATTTTGGGTTSGINDALSDALAERTTSEGQARGAEYTLKDGLLKAT